MARTRIKICGIGQEDAALVAADAGADALGFVFVPSSPRFIEPEDAFALSVRLPPFITTVGLFVNASLEKFISVEERCPTGMSQLHGNEDEELVQHCGPGVIKAVRFDPDTIERELTRWDALEEVDAILVDGSAGGQGTAFDWSALAGWRERISTPLILAGGLDPDNVGDAIRTVRPYGVDVSTGVEPIGGPVGTKDPARIRAFCDAVRAADSA